MTNADAVYGSQSRSKSWATGVSSSTFSAMKASERDAMQMALYPLAVPYLLNPAGITMLVIFSGAIDSWIMMAILVGLVLLMGAFDWLIFKNLDSLAEHLDKSRLAVTEAVFGVLLAALAVQLMLDGLADLGIISMLGGH